MKNYHIRPLPFWVLTDLQPAFYDSESGTVLQQLSRMYPKIQEVINSYNDFVREVKRYIEEFENGIITDFECFKNCIIKTMNDYIETIDMKINIQDTNISDAIDRQDKVISDKFDEQDEVIANAINYMQTNLIATLTSLFEQAMANNEITASLGITYNSANESLTFSISAQEEEGE